MRDLELLHAVEYAVEPVSSEDYTEDGLIEWTTPACAETVIWKLKERGYEIVKINETN